MLKKMLEDKKCFKLICGAGNGNLDEVEKLVALYAKSGCHFFDLSAKEEVFKAAKKGLDFSIPKEEQKDYHFCVSIGTKGDMHIQKVEIDAQKCTGCAKCFESCPQSAIIDAVGLEGEAASFKVIETNCIGCMKCQEACEFGAISTVRQATQPKIPTLQPSNLLTLSCVELHGADTDENEVDEIWDYLCENFDGMLSLCIGRKNLSNEQVLARVKRLVDKRKPYATIIQADGSPMSGGADGYKTTLQAVAMAEIIQGANLPVYIMLSGGTNFKTAELASLCGVDFNGIGIGSFARKIVKEFIKRDDFLTNEEVFSEAVKIAQNLIQSALK